MTAARTPEDVLGFLDLIEVDGAHGPEPYLRLDWQRDFVRKLFGMEGPRTALLFVPRKNGKTFFAAALALFDLMFGPESDPQVIVAATTTDQAKLVYDACRRIINGTPYLKRNLTPLTRPWRIVRKDGAGDLRIVPADHQTAQGLGASFAILDELHIAKSGDLWSALGKGQGHRAHPVRLGISTAGDDVDSFGHELWQMALNPPEHVISAVYHAPEGDPGDEELWRAANPSLGSLLRIENLRLDWEESQRLGPAEIARFERYHLNRWTSPTAAWEVADRWDTWAHPELKLQTLFGRDVWAGLDIGQVNDVTALVLACPGFPEEEKIGLLSVVWVADENAHKLGTPQEVARWRKTGWLRITPAQAGKTDLVCVAEDIIEITRTMRLANLGIDRGFQSSAVSGILSRAGIEVHEVSNAPQMLSPAIRDLEEDLFAGNVVHDGSELFAQHVRAADKRTNERGEAKLVKRKRGKPIDLVDAMCYAHSQVTRAPAASVPRVIGMV